MHEDVPNVLEHLLGATKRVRGPHVRRGLIHQHPFPRPSLQHVVHLLRVEGVELAKRGVGGGGVAFAKFHHRLAQTFEDPTLQFLPREPPTTLHHGVEMQQIQLLRREQRRVGVEDELREGAPGPRIGEHENHPSRIFRRGRQRQARGKTLRFHAVPPRLRRDPRRHHRSDVQTRARLTRHHRAKRRLRQLSHPRVRRDDAARHGGFVGAESFSKSRLRLARLGVGERGAVGIEQVTPARDDARFADSRAKRPPHDVLHHRQGFLREFLRAASRGSIRARERARAGERDRSGRGAGDVRAGGVHDDVRHGSSEPETAHADRARRSAGVDRVERVVRRAEHRRFAHGKRAGKPPGVDVAPRVSHRRRRLPAGTAAHERVQRLEVHDGRRDGVLRHEARLDEARQAAAPVQVPDVGVHRAEHERIGGVATGTEDGLVRAELHGVAERFAETRRLDVFHLARGHVGVRERGANLVLDGGAAERAEGRPAALVHRGGSANQG